MRHSHVETAGQILIPDPVVLIRLSGSDWTWTISAEMTCGEAGAPLDGMLNVIYFE